jgi:CheY-like chemotaxis protein
MKKISTGAPSAPSTAQPMQLPVLYVEDEQSNWDVAELRLKPRFNLLWARSAEEACTILRQHNGQFLAVLMDIQLKGSALDGIQLTRLLKGKPVDFAVPQFAQALPRLEAPVFFVTAFGSLHPEAALNEAGGEGLVPKPVDFIKLVTMLARANARKALTTLQGG